MLCPIVVAVGILFLILLASVQHFVSFSILRASKVTISSLSSRESSQFCQSSSSLLNIMLLSSLLTRQGCSGLFSRIRGTRKRTEARTKYHSWRFVGRLLCLFFVFIFASECAPIQPEEKTKTYSKLILEEL